MTTISRNYEMTAFFSAPWTYPGLPLRPAFSCRLHFGEAHHLVWSCWSIFDDGQDIVARRIEWPCNAGLRSQTGKFTRTFAAECILNRRLADILIAEAITAARSRVPTDNEACGIDGAHRFLQISRAADLPTLNWGQAAGDSQLDTWFDRAVDALNRRLPQSSANAYDVIGPEGMSSTAASDPRQP